MSIQELYEDNINEYLDVVGTDIAEDMSRMYFHGIACHDDLDDTLKAALVWELKSVEKPEDTESEIVCVFQEDSEGLIAALEEYSKRIGDDKVARSFFELSDIDETREIVFADSGFDMSTAESREIKIPLGKLRSLSMLKDKVPKYIKSLSEIDNDQFNQGMIRIMFNKNVGALDDMCYLSKEWYDQETSSCVITDGKVNGFFLVHRYPSGILVPVLLYAAGPYSKYDLLYMMRHSINSALAAYPEDTMVSIRRRNDKVRALATKLFPDEKGSTVISGQRIE